MENKGTSFALSMQLPVVLDQIILELMVSVVIFNLPMRLKKILKSIGVSLGLHSGSKNVLIKTFFSNIIMTFEIKHDKFNPLSSSRIMLYRITQHVMMLTRVFLSQKWAGPRTIANLACKTPKALWMSFQHTSCVLANSASLLFLELRRSSQTLTMKDICHLQYSSPLCNHAH